MVWESKSIVFQSKQIFYRAAGKGQPLVFLHGYMASSEIMLSLASNFITRFRIICPDLPGHGQSECLSEIHTMDQMARSVRAILQSEKIVSAHFCGHSMGGYVALASLKEYPGTCQSLVLLNSHPFNDTEVKRNYRKREIVLINAHRKNLLINQSIQSYFSHKPQGLYTKSVQLLQRIATEMSAEGMTAAQKGMLQRKDLSSLLNSCTIPFLWIAGEYENIPLSEADTTYDLLYPNKVIINGAGHMSFLENENAVSELLLRFYTN